jgi:hypothetical protein
MMLVSVRIFDNADVQWLMADDYLQVMLMIDSVSIHHEFMIDGQ